MNNRLQQFLELENLTPARLADMLGVQRSGLSHILSGRNKPSYDFLTRILTKFPHISADWLMTGQGKAYKESSGSVIISTPLPSSGNGVNFQGGRENFGVHGTGVGSGQIGISNNNEGLSIDNLPILDGFEQIFPDDGMDATTANNTYTTDTENITANPTTSQPAENCVNGAGKPVAGKKKRIKRVIVFYNDGSFEELFPHIG